MGATAIRKYEPKSSIQEPEWPEYDVGDDYYYRNLPEDLFEDVREETRSAAAAPENASKPSRMTIKRSLSPDGKIDSVSIEIELEIQGLPDKTIREKGLRVLQLESEIAKEFLGLDDLPQPSAAIGNGKAASLEREKFALPARLLDIGKTKNNSYFINVKIGNKTAKLFGTAPQLVAHIARMGRSLTPDAISEGLELNWNCRAITKPSSDGRYINVVQLFPAA